MKLYEYLAKGIMSKFGIPVPRGGATDDPAEAERIAASIGGEVVVKAQALVGGRGKAGGIKFADSPARAREIAETMLGSELKGVRIEKVLIEEKLKIDKEVYVGITVDTRKARPVLIASSSGGMEIEEVPEKEIVRRLIEPPWGLEGFMGREVTRRLGLSGPVAGRVADVIIRLYQVFAGCDAELTEINPLVISGDRVIAADARLNVDDDALYKHPELPRVEEGTPTELRVKSMGLSYVELDGDIAVMANGAGMAMATLDVLQRYGGRPANFLDAGGGASVEPMAEAIGILLSTKPKAILVNIFGGITRCDDVARALIKVKETTGFPVPVVIRLVGTNEEEGVSLLREHGFEAYRTMDEATRAVVEAAGRANPWQ